MTPLVCIVGWSGSGKTTFLERLIPELKTRGLRIGTVKHHKGAFEMDRPGKDSWRHKQAGSVNTVISSPKGIGMVMDVDHDFGPGELVPLFIGVDIILCEGFKRGAFPKLEIFRPEVHKHPFCLNDEDLIALVSDAEIPIKVPRFGVTDADGVASFLIEYFKIGRSRSNIP